MNLERYGFGSTDADTVSVKLDSPKVEPAPRLKQEMENIVVSHDVSVKRSLPGLEQAKAMKMEMGDESDLGEPCDSHDGQVSHQSNLPKASVTIKRKQKYTRYAKFKATWKAKPQIQEISLLRQRLPNGVRQAPLRDYLILGMKKGETVQTSNSTNVYD